MHSQTQIHKDKSLYHLGGGVVGVGTTCGWMQTWRGKKTMDKQAVTPQSSSSFESLSYMMFNIFYSVLKV